MGWLTLALGVLTATLQPATPLEPTPWGKNRVGHLLPTGRAFHLEFEGPLVFVLEIRAAKGHSDVAVSVERNTSFVSNNTVRLSRRARGPKGFPLLGKLMVSVPKGSHRYAITTSIDAAVRASTTRKVIKRFAAALEEPRPILNKADRLPDFPEAPVAPSQDEASADISRNDSVPPSPEALPQPPKTNEIVIPSAAPEIKALRVLAHKDVSSSSPEASTQVNRALRVAVYDFELQGIEPTIGAVVTDSVLAEVRKLQGVSAIGMAEIRDMLSHETNKQYVGCDSDESCLAEIAGALGVDDLITGKLSKTAEQHVMLVRRIDQANAKVTSVFDKRLTMGSGQEFLLSIGPAVEQLFRERDLREGLRRGVPDKVALRLDPPPLPTWSFWSVVGASAASVAVGGIFGLLAQSAQGDYDDYVALANSQVIDGRTLNQKSEQVDSRATAANASLIAAGVFALAAGVMYLFTDWDDVSDAS